MHVPDPPSDAGVFLYSLLCAFVLFFLGFSPSLGLLFDSLDSTFVSYVCVIHYLVLIWIGGGWELGHSFADWHLQTDCYCFLVSFFWMGSCIGCVL